MRDSFTTKAWLISSCRAKPKKYNNLGIHTRCKRQKEKQAETIRDLTSNCTTNPYPTFFATAQHDRDSPIFSQPPSGSHSPLSQHADATGPTRTKPVRSQRTAKAHATITGHHIRARLLSIIGRPRPEAFKSQSSIGFQFVSKLSQIRRRTPAQKLFHLLRESQQDQILQPPTTCQHDVNGEPPGRTSFTHIHSRERRLPKPRCTLH